MSKINLLLTLL